MLLPSAKSSMNLATSDNLHHGRLTNFGSSIVTTHVNTILTYSNPSVYEFSSHLKKCS